MESRRVGAVSALWRFPVKSMLGEERPELLVTETGVAGDRAYALRELATGRILSAKKFPQMFGFRAHYQGPAQGENLPPPTIALPDGRTVRADEPDASRLLSLALGFDVAIERPKADKRERASVDPRTVFGDVPINQVFPTIKPDEAPEYFGLVRGTFLDSATIHLLTTGTLAHVQRLAGARHLDCRRFRPNILVESEGASAGFVEDQWLGGTLEIGESLKIVAMQPALRCIMITLAQGDLEADRSILAAAAAHHQLNVGLFAAVSSAGFVRVGDPVYLRK